MSLEIYGIGNFSFEVKYWCRANQPPVHKAKPPALEGHHASEIERVSVDAPRPSPALSAISTMRAGSLPTTDQSLCATSPLCERVKGIVLLVHFL